MQPTSNNIFSPGFLLIIKQTLYGPQILANLRHDSSLNYTPPKTIMEPENDAFQKDSPFPGGPFPGSRRYFSGEIY